MVVYDSGNTKHTYQVPSGVQQIKIEVDGAGGGDGGDNVDGSYTGGGGVRGGAVGGVLPVSPGETLTVYVGDAGADASGDTPGSGGKSPWYSGGDGGAAGNLNAGAGGGGGGATAVIRDSDSASIAVGEGGGGGGGAAYDASIPNPGGGGGGGGARGGAGGVGGSSSDSSIAGADGAAGSGAGSGGAGGDGGEDLSFSGADGALGGAAVHTDLTDATTTTGGGFTGSGQVIISEAPPAPALTVGSVTDTTISLSWGDVNNEDNYIVEFRQSGTSNWTQFSTPGANTTSETITGLAQGTEYEVRVGATNSAGTSNSGIKTTTTVAPAPTLDSVSVVNGDQLDVQWTRNGADETDYRVLLSYDGNAYQQANGDLSPLTTQYTTGEQLDGEQLSVKVRAVYPDTTADSGTQTATTALPDADQPVLGNGVEDEISVDRETAPTDNGQVRWQVRETGQSVWGSSAVGFDEGTVAFDTVSFPITGREDGEEYEVRLRTETEHVTGAWTTLAVITTKFPTPAGASATADSPTQVTLSWTDQADNEDGFEVERRRLYADGPGPWSQLATLAPNTEQYVDDTVQPGVEVEYRVTAFTEHVSAAETDTVTTPSLAGTVSSPVASSGYSVEIERDDGTIRRPSPLDGVTEQPRLNGRPGIEIPLRPDLSWLDASWEGADLRVWRDGQRLPIDEVASVQPQPGQTTLRGQGGAALRTRHQQDVTDLSAHDVCRDILDATGLSYTVDAAPTDEGVEIVTIDSQEALADALDSPVDAPVQVTNGGIEPLRTAYLTAANDIQSSKLESRAGQNWTVSEAIRLDPGENTSWTVDLDYPIPGEHVDFWLRGVADEMAGVVTVTIDGDVIASEPFGNQNGTDPTAADKTVNWMQFFDVSGLQGEIAEMPDLDAGQHTITVSRESSFADGAASFNEVGRFYIDVGGPLYDERYATDPSNWVNTLTTGNLLDGPPGPYAAVDADFIGEAALDRVTGGRLDATLSSTANEQAIGIRPSDATLAFETNANSDSVETDFATDQSRLDARVTLAATDGDVGNDVTRYRTQPQRLDALTITADVLRSVTISDRSLDNRAETLLSQITDQADLIWEVQWRDGGQYVVVTRPGQRQSDADPDLVDWSVSKDINRQLTQVAIYGSSQRVEGESFVADINEVSLDFDRIQQDSERVYEEHSDGSVTVYERGADADYVMEYLLGNIRIVAGSDMVDGQQYQIDYSEQALGEVFAGGGVSADYPLVEEIPALHTDLQCQRAAEILLRQADGPIWSATVTIADDVGFALTEAIDPSRVPTPPGGAGLRVESVDNQPGQVRLELGVGQSLDALVSTLQNKLSETARQT